MTYAPGSIWTGAVNSPPRQVVSDDGTVVVYRDMVPARSGDSNYMRCAPAKASSAEFASWAITQRQDYEDLIDNYDETP